MSGSSAGAGSNVGRLGARKSMQAKKGRRSRVGRGRGASGVLGFMCSRRFIFFPGKPKSGSNVAGWWLELLINIGHIVMTLLMETLSSVSGNAETKIIGSSIARVGMGPEDLLLDSPLSHSGKTDEIITFRQGKLTRIRVKITPQSEVGKRSGQLHACITAVTPSQVADDYAVKATEVCSVEELRAQPGAVSWSAASGKRLNFRFKKDDAGAQWVQVGAQKAREGLPPGGDVTFYIWLAYENFSSVESSDVASNYNPAEAIFTVEVSGYVQLRECDQSVTVRKSPVILSKPSGVGWEKVGRRYILSDAVMSEDGTFRRCRPRTSDDPPLETKQLKSPATMELDSVTQDLEGFVVY